MPKLAVVSPHDWLEVARIDGPIVDPLILRCGDLFLRGAAGVADPNGAWRLFERNLHAIGMFFDRIVLDQQLPVFDYVDSFDIGMNFESRTLSQVNASEEILVEVQVDPLQHSEARRGAVAELMKLYDGPPRIDPQAAFDVLGELTDSGYAWFPQIAELTLPNEHETRLAQYLLGGLIFGAYAQRAGANHLLQPKRSRLMLSVALGQPMDRRFEESLFDRLREVVTRPLEDLPYTPTFFPYLLGKAGAAGPRGLLRLALDLRRSPEVRDYRQWVHGALLEFDAAGSIPTARRREVEAIADAVRRRIDPAGVGPAVEMKTVVLDVAKDGVHKTASKAAIGAFDKVWGFFIDLLPGRRHRTLLTRALVADAEHVVLENHVRSVWSGPGFVDLGPR